MSKFCDNKLFKDAVEKANQCMKTNSPCECLKIEKDDIESASCATEPLKTFFKDGCLSLGCEDQICSFN
ncbi:hypothetical protein KM1_017400 [Entamoeba histolytica HM-3:IMSS]|nr:hypothetical protein KM1_017400 [Entamoeba histolytica HM-3:IMSS]ENY63489.1 unknown protein, putative [Entamoeba histolytica HM-1:IMSS-A]